MSLSAVRIIANIAHPEKVGLLDSFYSQRPASQGLFFRGDKNRMEFFPVSPADGSATMFWMPETINPSSLSLGIGDSDQPAEGGTFDLSYCSDDSSLTGLDHAISAVALQSAINANTAIVALDDSVAVTLLATGIYQVAFQSVGSRALLASDAGKLLPECSVLVSRIQTGDETTTEIQLIQVVQRPYVYVSSWTPTSAATATVTTIRAGSSTATAMFDVNISPLPYAGSFSVDGNAAMAFNGAQSDWQTAIGTEWYLVKTGDSRFTIENRSVGTSTFASADIDVSGLSVFTGLSGTLGFNAGTLFKRFLSESSGAFSTTLEVVYSDGTYRSVLLHVPVTLTKEILSSGSLAPSNWNGGFYTKSEVDAKIALVANPVVSSGAISDITTGQQDVIVEGTIVTTTDGHRWVYTGTGTKTLEASYINLADISPASTDITDSTSAGRAMLTAANAAAQAALLAGDFATSAQGALADSALQDATAFATAAQGSKADSAVQPGTTLSHYGITDAAPSSGIAPSAITGTAVVTADSRLSDARTPTSHTHGNITNGGLVGTTANLPLITGTGGIVSAGAFGTGSTNFSAGNHTHSGVYEPVLGNPGTTGYVLSSTSSGTRSWVAQSGGGGIVVTNSTTAPSSPAAGDRWVDTSTMNEYEWYGSQWVQTGPSAQITTKAGVSFFAATMGTYSNHSKTIAALASAQVVQMNDGADSCYLETTINPGVFAGKSVKVGVVLAVNGTSGGYVRLRFTGGYINSEACNGSGNGGFMLSSGGGQTAALGDGTTNSVSGYNQLAPTTSSNPLLVETGTISIPSTAVQIYFGFAAIRTNAGDTNTDTLFIHEFRVTEV